MSCSNGKVVSGFGAAVSVLVAESTFGLEFTESIVVGLVSLPQDVSTNSTVRAAQSK